MPCSVPPLLLLVSAFPLPVISDVSPSVHRVWISLAIAGCVAAIAPAAFAWEPTKPVEFIVPAGTGGGADQMARMLQGVITKNNLMKQPMIVVNKSGGAGAEGFLAMKEAKGDPNKIIITLSNLFTTPLATGVPFNWKDLTPVAMLALDQFVLWVNAETPYKTAKDYLAAVKAGGPNKFKMGGTGSKQEDQIITVAIEKATGTKFTYVPFKGGGDVAVQLVGKHIDSTVNNPIEAIAQWRAGSLRPLCVFDNERMPYKTKVTDTMSWNDIPTCKEAGVAGRLRDAARHLHAGGRHARTRSISTSTCSRRCVRPPDWKKFMEEGAFNATFMTGADYAKWVESAEKTHVTLMQEAGFLAKP